MIAAALVSAAALVAAGDASYVDASVRVDGTLLDSSSKCHPAAAAAVAEACAHDHVRFFIATGKCRAGALAALPSQISDVLEGGVFVNGLVAYDAHGEIVHERRLNGAVI